LVRGKNPHFAYLCQHKSSYDIYNYPHVAFEKGVQERHNNGLRAIRKANIRVGWKWSVSNVVSAEHKQTQGQSWQPTINQRHGCHPLFQDLKEVRKKRMS